MKSILFSLATILALTSHAQWTQVGNDMPGDSDSEFGIDVDFNYAGDVMIAGTNSNYVKVYQEVNGQWIQLGSTLSGAVGISFGWAVSINGQGNIIAIGAFGAEGSISIYELINSEWSPLGEPIMGGIHNSYYDNFGFSVDMNEQGDRLVATSLYGNLGNGVESGFAQVYDLVNGQWTQIGSSLQGAVANAHFGHKVEMNAEGNRFVISNDGSTNSIFVYEQVGSDWELLGQPFVAANFGSILYLPSMDKTGNTITFAQYANPSRTHVYSLQGNTWVAKGTPLPQRSFCSLNGDGSILCISDNNDESAWVYQYQGNDWVLIDAVITGTSPDYFGTSNELNYSGNRVLVGAVGVGPSLTGAVRVFENASIPYNPIPYQGNLPSITAQCSVANIQAPWAYNNASDSIMGMTETQFPILESTTVIWVYTDATGLSSTQSQEVIIMDLQAPVPNQFSLEDITSACMVTSLTAPTATDNCSSEVSVTHDTDLPITEEGSTLITWTYTDESGNSSTQSQNVIITPLITTVTQNGSSLSADQDNVSYQWIDCENNMEELSGENGQVFLPSENGSYAVIIDNGICAETSDCINVVGVGLPENTPDTAPFICTDKGDGWYTLNLGRMYHAVKITMTDVNGRALQVKNFNGIQSLDFQIEEAPGVYLLFIESEHKMSSLKVVKD